MCREPGRHSTLDKGHSALAASIVGALGLGLSYVFGMVFPLLLAAVLWDQVQLGERVSALQTLPRLRIRGWSLSLSDGVVSGMFIAIGAVALSLAVTGQSTYAPDALAAWSKWTTRVAGNTAAALQAVSVPVQALVLGSIAAGICVAVYVAWRREAQR